MSMMCARIYKQVVMLNVHKYLSPVGTDNHDAILDALKMGADAVVTAVYDTALTSNRGVLDVKNVVRDVIMCIDNGDNLAESQKIDAGIKDLTDNILMFVRMMCERDVLYFAKDMLYVLKYIIHRDVQDMESIIEEFTEYVLYMYYDAQGAVRWSV